MVPSGVPNRPDWRRTPSATALPRCRRRDPPYYVPEGDSPLSLHATVLSSRVVLSFVSRHRAGVRATTPVEQVRGGARKSGSSAVVLRQGVGQLLIIRQGQVSCIIQGSNLSQQGREGGQISILDAASQVILQYRVVNYARH